MGSDGADSRPRGPDYRLPFLRGASGRVGARRVAFLLIISSRWECGGAGSVGGLGVWRWSGTRCADLLVPMPSPIKVLSNILIEL